MSSKLFTALLMCFLIGMVLILIAALTLAKPRTQLALSYLSQTNETGRFIASFEITNIGNVPITGYGAGSVEILGQSSEERVQWKAGVSRITPGAQDIVRVYLPTPPQRPWRCTIYYSRDGLNRRFWTTSQWIRPSSPPAGAGSSAARLASRVWCGSDLGR